jgi:hypothetical protein
MTMIKCMFCTREFSDRERQRKHIRAAHKHFRINAAKKNLHMPVKGPVHVVPLTVHQVLVLTIYKAERQPPKGFSDADLPLCKLSYMIGEGPDSERSWCLPQICEYEMNSRKFLNDFAMYMMSRVVITKSGKSLITYINT